MQKQTHLAKLIYALPITLALTTAACSDSDMGSGTSPIVVAPPPVATPAPPPPPPATTANFDVSTCLNQTIPGTGGVTVAGAVIPDTLTLNLAAASGFPNGRRLPDPVIDVTLAIIFLDINSAPQSPFTLAGVPVNPPANDVAFRSSFPYLAAPQGTPPLSGTAGTNFNFRTDAPSAYTRVDRMGMPAVSTALISSAMKNAYNDANPADDVIGGGKFAGEITSVLTGLTNALADDLTGLGLKPCARPR